MERNRPEKIRHHTVPQRYLKGFSVADEVLVQYNRESLNGVHVNLKDASVVRRMYSVKRRDGTWDDSIEDYFMKLEEATGIILENLLAGNRPTKEEQCKFALYIARQMQRGQYIAAFARNEAAKFLDHDFVLKMFETNRGELESRYGDKRIADALAAFQQTDDGVNIDDKTYLRHLIASTPPFAAIIADMHWRLERADEPGLSTSDHPVAVRRRGQAVNGNVVGLLDDDAELYFPLDRSTMLICSTRSERDWKRAVGKLRVRELNRITVINAFRFVFTPSRDAVVEALLREHKGDCVRLKEMAWH